MEQNAGYTIRQTECYHTRADGAEEHVVLGKVPGEERYVTWEALRHPEGHWDYFWGHYHTNRLAALMDYHDRLAVHYENQKEGSSHA